MRSVFLCKGAIDPAGRVHTSTSPASYTVGSGATAVSQKLRDGSCLQLLCIMIRFHYVVIVCFGVENKSRCTCFLVLVYKQRLLRLSSQIWPLLPGYSVLRFCGRTNPNRCRASRIELALVRIVHFALRAAAQEPCHGLLDREK